jgi:hypothetical protein
VLDDLSESRAAIELTLRPGPGGAGPGFRVDPEKAQACIDESTATIGALRKSFSAGLQLQFAPPSLDRISANLAECSEVMAGRAEQWMTAWLIQSESVRDALREQLVAYGIRDPDPCARARAMAASPTFPRSAEHRGDPMPGECPKTHLSFDALPLEDLRDPVLNGPGVGVIEDSVAAYRALGEQIERTAERVRSA